MSVKATSSPISDDLRASSLVMPFFLWKASGNQAMNHDRSGIFKNSWEFFQGLVTVPFWVYWTSPYSSQIGPYN